jgi:hypothetical protein
MVNQSLPTSFAAELKLFLILLVSAKSRKTAKLFRHYAKKAILQTSILALPIHVLFLQ